MSLRMHPAARRLLAAVSGLFVLQLMLLASGTLRSVHHAACAGASMPATHAASAPHSNGMGDHDECGLPFAPGACASSMMCGINIAPAPMVAVPASPRIVAPARTSLIVAHAGPTFAPELPPPRA